MRDTDSPIACSGNWYMKRRSEITRKRRLSKSRAGYKQSDPWVDVSPDREDVFDFLCVRLPEML